MVFNSIDFLCFFPIVTLIYFIIPKRFRYIWLLLSSYYFYMCWNAKYAVLIAISTVVTYLVALLVEKQQQKKKAKLYMVFGFVINLGILFFFKYFNFTLANLNKILSIMHIRSVNNPFSLLLPVGISFYTFQALGYMIDVYRGECKAERNLLKYALFVSFFPQLVAGPIERSKNLLGQIEKSTKEYRFSLERLSSGFAMMVFGMFMKMVIADRVSLFVDRIFLNTIFIGSIEAIAGAVGFAIQIYCDFGGYSAIAIGAARIMGFDLMENFNTPYLSASIAEFWRRWHISLSTWFKDYVYIPLGGSRCSKLKKYRNLMITFLVSGLWHGASWTYVIWGAIHGIYQVVSDICKPLKERLVKALKIRTEVFSFKFFKIATTFILTDFAWIFFRAGSIGEAFGYIKALFTRWNPWVIFDESIFSYGLDRREMGILLAAVLILIIVDFIRNKTGKNIGEWLWSQNLLFRWAIYIVLVAAVLVYGEYGIDFNSAQFIYFAF